MDASTVAQLEEVRTLLEGEKTILLKKTFGLDTSHIEGMVKGVDKLQIGKRKYGEYTHTGTRLGYEAKFEKDGQTRFGSLRVEFHVSQKDGIEMTWMLVDKGEWVDKATEKKSNGKSEYGIKTTKGKKLTPLQAKLKSIGYGSKKKSKYGSKKKSK
jgi:hypothetical protein